MMELRYSISNLPNFGAVNKMKREATRSTRDTKLQLIKAAA